MASNSSSTVNLGMVVCLCLGFVDLGLLDLWAAPKAFPERQEKVPYDLPGFGKGRLEEKATPEPQRDPGQETAPPKQGPSEGTAPAPEPPVASSDKPAEPAPETPATPETPAAGSKSGLPKAVLVYFDSNSKVLRPNEQKRLKRLAGRLSQVRMVIEGHTDQRGSQEKNSQLSVERAEEVMELLKGFGVPADNMKVRGVGATKPADTRVAPEAWQKNRRVEIRIY